MCNSVAISDRFFYSSALERGVVRQRRAGAVCRNLWKFDRFWLSADFVCFAPLSVLTVFGSVNVSSQLTVTSGAVFSSDKLILGPGASMVVIVPFFPAPEASTTIVVASYNSSLTGVLSTVTASAASGVPPSCGSVTATPNYGSSSLSVTVATSSCGALSTGALVGIIVGAVVGGVLIAVAIVVLVRFMEKRHEEQMKMSLGK